jgi:hypothetical protein
MVSPSLEHLREQVSKNVVIETNRGEKGKEPDPDQWEGKMGK